MVPGVVTVQFPFEFDSPQFAPATSVASFCVLTDTLCVVPPVTVAQPVVSSARKVKAVSAAICRCFTLICPRYGRESFPPSANTRSAVP